MGDQTLITWCDYTFNPRVGCMKVSPACDGCYAEHLMQTRQGRARWGGPGRGVGTRDRTSPAYWRKPVAWDRAAAAAGTRPLVFCASLADVFDNAVPMAWRFDLFELIAATPNLTWLLLTKRPQNIMQLFREAMHLHPGGEAANWPFNAAIGSSIEDRQRRDLNGPALATAIETLQPAFGFWSCEPLLEDLGDVSAYLAGPGAVRWVITGGETDQGAHKARPSHPDWFRSLRDQCAAAGVPFHFKQWGEWAPGEAFGLKSDGPLTDRWGNVRDWNRRFVTTDQYGDRVISHSFTEHSTNLVYRIGKARAGRSLDGVIHDAMPGVC